MRSTHAPQACITDRRSTSRTEGVHHVPKERITQKSPICLVDKSDFFVGGLEGDRTLDLTDANRTLSQLSYEPLLPVWIILPCKASVKNGLFFPFLFVKNMV